MKWRLAWSWGVSHLSDLDKLKSGRDLDITKTPRSSRLRCWLLDKRPWSHYNQQYLHRWLSHGIDGSVRYLQLNAIFSIQHRKCIRFSMLDNANAASMVLVVESSADSPVSATHVNEACVIAQQQQQYSDKHRRPVQQKLFETAFRETRLLHIHLDSSDFSFLGFFLLMRKYVFTIQFFSGRK